MIRPSDLYPSRRPNRVGASADASSFIQPPPNRVDASADPSRPLPIAPTAPIESGGTATFPNVVRFEWTKLWSGRSTLWTLVATALIMPVLAVFVASTGSLQPDDTILGGSLTGAVPAQLVAAAFGALVMSGEYTTGMIRTTLTAAPRRLTVLSAKAAVAAAVLFTVSLPASALAFVTGWLMLDRDAYATGDAWPALLGIAVMVAGCGLLGLAVGTVLRHSAGAIAVVAGVLMLPALFGPLFGDLQRWVGGASPSGALEKLTQTSDASHETVGALGAWPSLAVVLAYVLLALVGSAWLLQARDA